MFNSFNSYVVQDEQPWHFRAHIIEKVDVWTSMFGPSGVQHMSWEGTQTVTDGFNAASPPPPQVLTDSWGGVSHQDRW